MLALCLIYKATGAKQEGNSLLYKATRYYINDFSLCVCNFVRVAFVMKELESFSKKLVCNVCLRLSMCWWCSGVF